MSLFDQLVDVALRTRADLSPLRPVVEKEQTRYGLPVRVSEPVKSGGNVSTWKLVIETRPGQKHLPAQRINVDICAIPSHDRRPMMLRNLYGVDLGTSGLILQAQSREEILADKVVALAWRENRIKNRDLWDILWLLQQGVELPLPLIPKKIHDRKRKEAEFIAALETRLAGLRTQPALRTDFVKEMRRFLPPAVVRDTLSKKPYWSYLVQTVSELGGKAISALKSRS